MTKAKTTAKAETPTTIDVEALWSSIPEVDPQAELKASIRGCLHCGKPIVFEQVESPVRDKDGNVVNHLNTDGSDSGVPCMKVSRIPRDLVRREGEVTVDHTKGHDCPNRPAPSKK